MAAVGQCTPNAHAERVLRTIKEEEVYLADYESFGDAYHRKGFAFSSRGETRSCIESTMTGTEQRGK